jgi:hypothetical protein
MRRPVDRIDSSLQFQSMQRVMAPLLQSPRYFDVTLPTRKQTQCLGVTHMQCDDFNVVVFASLHPGHGVGPIRAIPQAQTAILTTAGKLSDELPEPRDR